MKKEKKKRKKKKKERLKKEQKKTPTKKQRGKKFTYIVTFFNCLSSSIKYKDGKSFIWYFSNALLACILRTRILGY